MTPRQTSSAVTATVRGCAATVGPRPGARGIRADHADGRPLFLQEQPQPLVLNVCHNAQHSPRTTHLAVLPVLSSSRERPAAKTSLPDRRRDDEAPGAYVPGMPASVRFSRPIRSYEAPARHSDWSGVSAALVTHGPQTCTSLGGSLLSFMEPVRLTMRCSDTSNEERERIEEEWSLDPPAGRGLKPVLLLSKRAGGVGLMYCYHWPSEH